MLQPALAFCSCVIRLKRLFSFAKSSAGLPSSATLPSARTTISSAASTVRIRWAMTSTVFPESSRDSAPCTFVSFSTSREAVASSKSTIGAFFKRARAIEIRWRSPPESFAPFSPMGVNAFAVHPASQAYHSFSFFLITATAQGMRPSASVTRTSAYPTSEKNCL